MGTDEWLTGNVVLNIKGMTLDMELTVPAAPVKPQRMLPVFHQVTNAFVALGVAAAEASGNTISCKAGCGACCRHAVPITEVEIYQIAELVESMPEPRRTEIKQRFRDAVEHFKKIGWFEKMNRQAEAGKMLDPTVATKKAMEVVMEYFHENIPCPFLENESCSIHENRPLSCREYLVTSPAENCSQPSAETIRKVELLTQPSKSMEKIGRSGRMNGVGTYTLVRALDLAERFPDEFSEKSGEKWMADFFETLTGDKIPAPDKPQEQDDRYRTTA